MTAKTLSSLVGGGGFRPTGLFSCPVTIPSGASGTVLTLTAPDNKIIRLTALSGNDSGMTLVSDGNTIVSGKDLRTQVSADANSFLVGEASIVSFTGVHSNTLPFVDGKVITLSKASGTTGNAIVYAYVIGENL